jgi:hypothetical protein
MSESAEINPEDSSVYFTLPVECNDCGLEMEVHVGLTLGAPDIPIFCINCQRPLTIISPGPIIVGPFPRSNRL